MNKGQKVWYALTHAGNDKLAISGSITAASALVMLIIDSVICYRNIK